MKQLKSENERLNSEITQLNQLKGKISEQFKELTKGMK